MHIYDAWTLGGDATVLDDCVNGNDDIYDFMTQIQSFCGKQYVYARNYHDYIFLLRVTNSVSNIL